MEGKTFSLSSSSHYVESVQEPSLAYKKRRRVKAPDCLNSVGWTRPKVFFLSKENGGKPFELECGKTLKNVVIEYEMYGSLNPDKTNAILITHALSGDAHVAGWDSTASEGYRGWRLRAPGWWDNLVGPKEPFDTDRFCIICANVLGSCYGTTGPASPNPDDDNRPYGMKFPSVTVGDWVKSQVALIDYLGIRQLYAVVGGSLGGQQALEWAIAYPDRVGKCIMLASGAKLPVQGLGFNHVAAVSISGDPGFRNGRIYNKKRVLNPLYSSEDAESYCYYDIENRNLRSLHAARMLAHITYLSPVGMESKFGRRLQPVKSRDNKAKSEAKQESELAVHGYLTHQGENFVERFDANSYLMIARAMDNYDAAEKWGNGDIVKACERIKAEVMVVAFTSDWLYPLAESHSIVMALMQSHHPVTSVDVESNYGHDAFLVEEDKVTRIIRSFLLTPAPARLLHDGEVMGGIND